MNTASLRTALIAAVTAAIGAFALLSIGGATAQQTCIQPLAGNGTVSGTWDNTCLSENTPLGDYSYPTGTRYARFYTFTLGEPSTVTVELKSSADTYMYLMQAKGKTGAILHYNDDIAPNEDTNSRISQSLSAGDYTIEATTYDVEITGSFTLTVSGLPANIDAYYHADIRRGGCSDGYTNAYAYRDRDIRIRASTADHYTDAYANTDVRA